MYRWYGTKRASITILNKYNELMSFNEFIYWDV